MASRPYFDGRGWWLMKYKPDPKGPWEIARLCKHDKPWSKDRPPKKPIQLAEDRAREFAEIEYRAAHGLGVAPARPRGLDSYVADYLDLYRTAQRAGSVRHMERHARTFLDFAKARGIASLQAVTRPICRDYLESRFKLGVGHGTLKTEWGYLSGIWARAVDDGLMAVNPWKGVTPPGERPDSTWTHWPNPEIDRIAEACLKPWQSDLVLVLGRTGLRLSTALAMRWDWIDWGQGTITIPTGPDIKTQYEHVIGDQALDILQRRNAASKSDLVFPNPYRGGGIIPSDTARKAIDKAIGIAGVKSGTPHDLRHSYARNLALSGVPITVVSRQLGHTSITMTMRYATADADNVRDAIGKAERLSASAAIPPSA